MSTDKKHDNNISMWKYFANDTQRVDRKQHDNNISKWKYFANDTQRVQIGNNMTIILVCENISPMIHNKWQWTVSIERVFLPS